MRKIGKSHKLDNVCYDIRGPVLAEAMRMERQGYDIVKLNIFLTDMERFAEVNEIMKRYFTAPFPARAAIAVRALPRDVQIEIEGVMAL